jgi:uncharacterized protein YacL
MKKEDIDEERDKLTYDYPVNLDDWPTQRKLYIPNPLQSFRNNNSCDEKKNFIEGKISKKSPKLIQNKEKRMIDFIYYGEKISLLIFYILPILVAIFIMLLELKIFNVIKTLFFYSFIPLIILLVLVYIQCFLFIFSKNKKWENFIFFNHIFDFSRAFKIGLVQSYQRKFCSCCF